MWSMRSRNGASGSKNTTRLFIGSRGTSGWTCWLPSSFERRGVLLQSSVRKRMISYPARANIPQHPNKLSPRNMPWLNKSPSKNITLNSRNYVEFKQTCTWGFSSSSRSSQSSQTAQITQIDNTKHFTPQEWRTPNPQSDQESPNHLPHPTLRNMSPNPERDSPLLQAELLLPVRPSSWLVARENERCRFSSYWGCELPTWKVEEDFSGMEGVKWASRISSVQMRCGDGFRLFSLDLFGGWAIGECVLRYTATALQDVDHWIPIYEKSQVEIAYSKWQN